MRSRVGGGKGGWGSCRWGWGLPVLGDKGLVPKTCTEPKRAAACEGCLLSLTWIILRYRVWLILTGLVTPEVLLTLNCDYYFIMIQGPQHFRVRDGQTWASNQESYLQMSQALRDRSQSSLNPFLKLGILTDSFSIVLKLELSWTHFQRLNFEISFKKQRSVHPLWRSWFVTYFYPLLLCLYCRLFIGREGPGRLNSNNLVAYQAHWI